MKLYDGGFLLLYPTECPNCKSDLRYHDGSGNYRVIGLYAGGRTTHWKCPDCNHVWVRKSSPDRSQSNCATCGHPILRGQRFYKGLDGRKAHLAEDCSGSKNKS